MSLRHSKVNHYFLINKKFYLQKYKIFLLLAVVYVDGYDDHDDHDNHDFHDDHDVHDDHDDDHDDHDYDQNFISNRFNEDLLISFLNFH